MRHAPRWAWSVVLLAAAVGARADDAKPKDPPKDEAPKTAAEQYQALVKEYQTAIQEFMQAYRAASSPEDRRKIIQEKQPKPQDYAKRFLELAKKNAQEPAAFDALAWLCTNVPGTTEAKEATEIVLKDHIKNQKLGMVIPRLGSGPDTEKTLRRIIAESPHKDAQGIATYYLARLLKSDKAEAEKLLKEVIAKYADVILFDGRLGMKAKGQLNELHGLLEVGKPAMDIEAEDIDGTKFKLSDYRGKVVMLDFWGHW